MPAPNPARNVCDKLEVVIPPSHRLDKDSIRPITLEILQTLYTLYSYTGAKEHIILTSGEKTLVIGMSDPKETQAIYDAMLEKVDK